MAEWRVVDFSPGIERLPVRIYEGMNHIATVFDGYAAEKIVAEHNAAERRAEPDSTETVKDDLVRAFAQHYHPTTFRPEYSKEVSGYDRKLATEDGLDRLDVILRIFGDRWAIVPVEPTLEQQDTGYDVLKQFFPEEYKKENPIGHYRVYTDMVEKGRVR